MLRIIDFLMRRKGKVIGELRGVMDSIDKRKVELASLRRRLEIRKKALSSFSFKARRGETNLPQIIVEEEREINEILNAVGQNEAALSQLQLRFGNVYEYGEIVKNLNTTFDNIRRITCDVSKFASEIRSIGEEMSSTISQTMTDLSGITLSLGTPIKTDEGQQIIADTLRILNEEHSWNHFTVTPERNPTIEQPRPFLLDGEPVPIIGSEEMEVMVRNYMERENEFDVQKASKDLGIDVEEVERVLLQLYPVHA